MLLADATSYCQQANLLISTPSTTSAATVPVAVSTRDCSSCASSIVKSTATFEFQLSVPTIEPGHPSPASGSVLGKYFITLNVRYLVMDGVLPPFFVADFVTPATGVITSQHTGIPFFSSQDPLVTVFLLQVPAGNEGVSAVNIRHSNSNATTVSFDFTYIPDTTPVISLVQPREVSALGGQTVQLLTTYLTNMSNGMPMQIAFANISLIGSYTSSSETTQQMVEFVAPFANIESQQTSSVQLTYEGTVIAARLGHLPLPQIDYIECSTSSSCTGTVGQSITIDVWVSFIPLSCDCRPAGCTANTYLPDCAGTCTDVVADLGSHGHGTITLINRDDGRTLVRVVSQPFVGSSLGIVTAELKIHSDTRFKLSFDILVEAAGTPVLVGDYSSIYLLTTGHEQVNVQVAHMQVAAASELEVTFDGISTSASSFSINSTSDQISFNFLSAALADSKAGGTAQVVVTKAGSYPVLSVAFSVFIQAALVPTFHSASPPFVDLSSLGGSHSIRILVDNVVAYGAAAVAMNFSTQTLVLAQSVVASRPSLSSNLLQLDVVLAAGVQAGNWEVWMTFTEGSAPQYVFTYLIRDPVPQVLSIQPSTAYTSEQVVLSIRHLDLSTASTSTVQVRFTTQAGSVYYGLITALSDEAVTVQVPDIGQASDVNSIDVAVIAPVGTALFEKAFDWKVSERPNPLMISPTSGLQYGGFEIVTTAEGFVGELTANDFFINFGDTSITEFTVTRTLAAIHRFTFTAPIGLQSGTIKVNAGLVANTYSNVSYNIRISDASAPYLSGSVHPSHCYTQGGGTVSALIKSFPPNTNATAVVNWAGNTNVTAQTVITDTPGLSKDVQVTFAVPESTESTTHIEAVSIIFTSASPAITVSSEFVYSAMPAPVIYMNVSKAIYSGGTYIQLSLRNLGPRSASSELIVLFASQYKALVVSTVCKDSPSACENGLVECGVVVVTPQMTSLSEMGNVLVQAYWSDLGIGRAASSQELEICNPVLPSIPEGSIVPEEGYMTENTQVIVQAYGLLFAGQHYSDKDDIYAYFTPEGSTTQLPVACTGNQWIDSAEGNRNSITLIMPSYTTTSTVQITVQLRRISSIKATTSFTYYAIPSVAPRIQANPLIGPLTGGTTVLVELTSFYLCPLTTDLSVEFADSELSQYSWSVDWVSSSFDKTTVEVSTPLITNPADVYNSTTSAMQDLLVRIYPTKLFANKDTYGATFTFKYKPFSPVITELSPATGLIVGGMQARMTLANVGGITQASQLQIVVGQSVVPSTEISIYEKLDGILSIEFAAPSGSAGVANVVVQFTDGRPDASCDPAACNGFDYTTLTGAAVVLYGPSPSGIMTSSLQTEIKLGVSNFLPIVSAAAALTVTCNNNLVAADVLHYQANGNESYITLQMPQMSTAGLYSCTLQQTTANPNPATFDLTVSAPEVSVQEFYPLEAVVSDLVTVSVNNIVPSALSLVWLSGSTWVVLTPQTAVHTARLAQDSDRVWSGGTVATFSMPDAGASSLMSIGIRESGANVNRDQFEATHLPLHVFMLFRSETCCRASGEIHSQ